MNPLTQAILLSAALAGAAICHGQAPPAAPKPDPRNPAVDLPKIDFATLDTDGNGSLSKEESQVASDLARAFDALDADDNLALSKVEFLGWNRAGKVPGTPRDPATAPSGSAGAQHVPDSR